MYIYIFEMQKQFCIKTQLKTVVNEHVKFHQMKEARNKCFESKKRNTTNRQVKVGK